MAFVIANSVADFESAASFMCFEAINTLHIVTEEVLSKFKIICFKLVLIKEAVVYNDLYNFIPNIYISGFNLIIF